MADASIPVDFAAISEEALLGCWLVVGLDVPETLLQETLKRGPRMVPFLGALIAEPAAWEDRDTIAAWAPPHALMLLCAIGGPELVPHAAAFLRHGLGGDWLTEDGHMLVRACGIEALNSIAEVIGDSDADLYGRWAATDGLCLMALEQEGQRERITTALRTVALALLEKPEGIFTEQDRMVLTQLAQALALLHDEPSQGISERGVGKAYSYASHSADRASL